MRLSSQRCTGPCRWPARWPRPMRLKSVLWQRGWRAYSSVFCRSELRQSSDGKGISPESTLQITCNQNIVFQVLNQPQKRPPRLNQLQTTSSIFIAVFGNYKESITLALVIGIYSYEIIEPEYIYILVFIFLTHLTKIRAYIHISFY